MLSSSSLGPDLETTEHQREWLSQSTRGTVTMGDRYKTMVHCVRHYVTILLVDSTDSGINTNLILIKLTFQCIIYSKTNWFLKSLYKTWEIKNLNTQTYAKYLLTQKRYKICCKKCCFPAHLFSLVKLYTHLIKQPTLLVRPASQCYTVDIKGSVYCGTHVESKSEFLRGHCKGHCNRFYR